MKTFKILLCVLIATASLIVCSTSAKAGIGIVTNYDTLTLSVTIITNGPPQPINGGFRPSLGEMKLVTKDFLNLLTNSDFAGTTFPIGAKLVLGWDTNWNGDVLVVDKSGTNVLYDATYNNGNSTNASFNVFPFGIGIQRYIWNEDGNYTLTENHTANFFISDNNSQMDLFASANGPCTDHFTWRVISSDNTVWSDSQNFTLYGSYNQFPKILPPFTLPLPMVVQGIVNGSIKLSGHGEGIPSHLYIFTALFLPL